MFHVEHWKRFTLPRLGNAKYGVIVTATRVLT